MSKKRSTKPETEKPWIPSTPEQVRQDAIENINSYLLDAQRALFELLAQWDGSDNPAPLIELAKFIDVCAVEIGAVRQVSEVRS